MNRPGLMFEVWLRANRRIFAFAALLPALVLLVGVALLVSAWGDASRVWSRAAGAVLIGVSLVGLLLLHWQALPMARKDTARPATARACW